MGGVTNLEGGREGRKGQMQGREWERSEVEGGKGY